MNRILLLFALLFVLASMTGEPSLRAQKAQAAQQSIQDYRLDQLDKRLDQQDRRTEPLLSRRHPPLQAQHAPLMKQRLSTAARA